LVGRAEAGLVRKVDDGSCLLGESYHKLEKHISDLWDRFLDEILLAAQAARSVEIQYGICNQEILFSSLRESSLTMDGKLALLKKSPPVQMVKPSTPWLGHRGELLEELPCILPFYQKSRGMRRIFNDGFYYFIILSYF
jgi:hypothetical protein